MNAVQHPLPSPQQSASSHRRRSRLTQVRYVPEQRPRLTTIMTNRAIAFEAVVKLTGNLVLITIAVSGLVRLIPHYHTQKTELQQLQGAVGEAESKSARLKADFSRYFDPTQANRVMQEQSGRESPNQRQVVWVEPTYPKR